MEMPQDHLEIYNPTYDHEHNEFPSFALLPKELRLQIWELSLHRHRIIKIEIAERPYHFTPQTREEFMTAMENEFPVVPGHHLYSKLLRVNSEAREVALRFYRVRMHCNLENGESVKHGTLMFNPDFDIVQVKPNIIINRFAKLLHDLKALDPQGVGVRRLALEPNSVMRVSWRTDFPSMDPQIREAFTQIIAQLESVWFMIVEHAGRMWDPTGTGTATMIGKLEFHRSTPIMSKIPSFDFMERDPRPIADDLRVVYAGHSDSRELVRCWQRMLGLWGIEGPPLSNLRFVLAVESKGVGDRAHAERWLREEDEMWSKTLDDVEGRHTTPGSRVRECLERMRNDYNLERAPSPKNAVGFWIFPVEAMGPALNEHEALGNGVMTWKQVLDMSDYWPALGLSYLP
ncbi:hypothetical protein F4805DRAFT_118715 [Annulohypoxylon moriforme]|nr:hypothetical protein F4805DRAFT_118715 [Annulohypoxylon moriforme]